MYDSYISGEVIQYLKEENIEIIYSDIIDSKKVDEECSAISTDVHWTHNKEVMAGIHYYHSKVDGMILISSFPCGPDSLAVEMIKVSLIYYEQKRRFIVKDIISFPHLGDYHIPIAKLLRKLTKKEVIPAPPITKKTIELGSKYAPDTVCVPFKYNLGNYIEALDNGATILFQAGGGCRYRYYAEVQEKILKDLNYNFHFFKLISRDHVRIFETFHLFKELNPKLKFSSFIHTIIYTVFFIYYMDKCDNYIRKNIGFEKEKHSFQNLKII